MERLSGQLRPGWHKQGVFDCHTLLMALSITLQMDSVVLINRDAERQSEERLFHHTGLEVSGAEEMWMTQREGG